ncbi:hypothetical protein Hanom_Chr13g01216891 [Helianthus anomalus]
MRPLNRNQVVGTNLDSHVLLKKLVSVATDLLNNLTVESSQLNIRTWSFD